MGILDRLLGRKKGGGGMPELVQSLITEFGDVDQLIDKLQKSSISDEFSSWVGNGANASVTGADVSEALGGDAIAGIATRLGLDQKEAAARMANALPRLVNRLTPGGNLPAGGFDEGTVNDLLGGILRR